MEIGPDFFMAGTGKCRSTVLWASLNDHPKVYTSEIKTPGFSLGEKLSLKRRRKAALFALMALFRKDSSVVTRYVVRDRFNSKKIAMINCYRLFFYD